MPSAWRRRRRLPQSAVPCTSPPPRTRTSGRRPTAWASSASPPAPNGFTGASAVKFGTTNASFTVGSATSISATAPAGAAGTVDITVTTPAGTSATSAADQFTYVPAVPAPTVTGVSPTSGSTGGGTSV